MNRYAVGVCNGGSDDFWIEFYEADDNVHAEEQAQDANPGSAVVCVATATERTSYALASQEEIDAAAVEFVNCLGTSNRRFLANNLEFTTEDSDAMKGLKRALQHAETTGA